eukprot:6207317-Pleurochrysis_carterae.AAC.2
MAMLPSAQKSGQRDGGQGTGIQVAKSPTGVSRRKRIKVQRLTLASLYKPTLGEHSYRAAAALQR